MGISSRRGVRSIFSRKKTSTYSPMRGDDANNASVHKKESFTAVEQEAVAVSVLSSFSPASDFERVQSLKKSHDNIIVYTNTGSGNVQEDEKVSEDDYTCSQDSAIEMARNASAMTELVAQRMALASKRSFTSTFNTPFAIEDNIRYDAGEEKTEDPVGESSIAETSCHHKLAQDAWKCGNGLIETSRESVDSLFEASILSGKELMQLAEVSSQSVIEKRLPLSPLLEQASDKVETAFKNTMEEVNEFFVDHWNMLQRFVAARNLKNSVSSIDNVKAENPSSNVSVEVQIKATAE